MIEPGTYKAKLIDYGITESSNGKPTVVLKFINENGDEISHWMYLTEKAQPYTAKTLMVFGYNGEDLTQLAAGTEGGLLDTTKEVEIVMENEEWEGKTRCKVKWINEPGGGGFKKLAKAEATKLLAGVNLKAHVAEIRQATGTTDENPF